MAVLLRIEYVGISFSPDEDNISYGLYYVYDGLKFVECLLSTAVELLTNTPSIGKSRLTIPNKSKTLNSTVLLAYSHTA